MKLSLEFYQNSDVVAISKELLGCFLMTQINGIRTGGMIVETEAYKGPDDKACHAYGGRRTKRTEIMFARGGVAYVYVCYGIHHLFNIVTGPKDTPHAVLVRAIMPTIGETHMKLRRSNKKPLTTGPGTLAQALAINKSHTGTSLLGNDIWIEQKAASPKKIIASPRIGIDYAEQHASLPWRFHIDF